MESIMYNSEDKQVVIILGYGIGNHLSVKFLKGVVKDIRELFSISIVQGEELPFMQVAESSRSHRHMWYTRFPFDLSAHNKDQWGNIIISDKWTAHSVTSHKKGQYGWIHEDETAQSVINRLIHD